MRDLTNAAPFAFVGSLLVRIGGSVFVACRSRAVEELFYRVDTGARSVWPYCRGAFVSDELLANATEACHALEQDVRNVSLPTEFTLAYTELAASFLSCLATGSVPSQQAVVDRASSAVDVLASGLETAVGARDFERACQEDACQILTGWEQDSLAAVRQLRRRTDEWALVYQRFVRPELGSFHA
ncbi:hypothetical protein ABZ926_19115 [Streptomyces litmocidini]|uniref:hypothetical protein n=1 Tax=Streptomyces litmocidini TaxID=67318 RepID=UPI0033EA51DA